VRALFFIKPCKYCARRSEPVEKSGNLPPSERKISGFFDRLVLYYLWSKRLNGMKKMNGRVIYNGNP
jgi:hypothetical protein